MSEKSGEEFLFVNSFTGFPNGGHPLLVARRHKVRQVNVFDLIPAWLHRIQLRRVRREIMKLKPIRASFLEIQLGGMVSRKMVPHNDDLGTVIMMNFRQMKNDVFRVRRPGKHRETKIKIMPYRTSRDEAEHRVIVTPWCLKENRRFADRCPSRGNVRCQGDSAFVPENQRQTELARFFFSCGQVCCRQKSMAVCERFFDWISGFWQENPNERRIRQTWVRE